MHDSRYLKQRESVSKIDYRIAALVVKQQLLLYKYITTTTQHNLEVIDDTAQVSIYTTLMIFCVCYLCAQPVDARKRRV